MTNDATPAGQVPPYRAHQTFQFTPSQLRKAARRGGLTVTAEADGTGYLTLEWRYGLPEGEPVAMTT